jgi:gluconate:H+ symporter, GntP family
MLEKYWLIVVLLLSIIAIIGGTSKYKIHPFLVLLGASYFVALSAGMPAGKIAGVIASGFGNLMASIGLVIVLGTLLGVVLEKSGAAIKLAEIITRVVGPRYPALAMSLIGYIVSIPVFCDSAFVILTSVRKSLATRTGKSPVVLSIALATGLYATHTLVPPTPGPIAAAGNLGLENHLGLVILMGLAVAFVTMLAGYAWALQTGKHKITPDDIDSSSNIPEHSRKVPAGWKSLLPIILPIVLIGLRSFATFPSKPFGEGWIFTLLDFVGHPINALALGFAASLFLFPKFDKETLTGWIGEGITAAAPILLITGAGGAFGAVLKETQIADTLGNMLAQYQLGIFLPFVIAAIFKTAQGSSTVALVATSALIAPMLSSLGLDSVYGASLAVMAIGAGAMTVSHANDSYFWVVTQFSGINVSTGYKTHTVATLVQGITAMVVVWLMSVLIL